MDKESIYRWYQYLTWFWIGAGWFGPVWAAALSLVLAIGSFPMGIWALGE